MSPFRGQLSGKPLLATVRERIVTEIKAQGRVNKLVRSRGGCADRWYEHYPPIKKSNLGEVACGPLLQ
jgi:hypothetical protein